MFQKTLFREEFKIRVPPFFDEINEILLRKTFKAEKRNAALIFITTNTLHFLDGYQINVLHYLIKLLAIDGVEGRISERARHRAKVSYSDYG